MGSSTGLVARVYGYVHGSRARVYEGVYISMGSCLWARVYGLYARVYGLYAHVYRFVNGYIGSCLWGCPWVYWLVSMGLYLW